MVDDAVCKTRIVTQEWPHAAVSVRKCAASFFALVKEALLDGGGGGGDTGKAFERLTQELAQFEFAVSRLDHVARRCAEEAAHYRALHASIDERVVAATAEVQQLHAGLEAALLRRAQRQRYEEVAATVNQRPSRDVLEATLREVEAQISATAAEDAELTAAIRRRRDKFAAVRAAALAFQAALAGGAAGDDDAADGGTAAEQHGRGSGAAAALHDDDVDVLGAGDAAGGGDAADGERRRARGDDDSPRSRRADADAVDAGETPSVDVAAGDAEGDAGPLPSVGSSDVGGAGGANSAAPADAESAEGVPGPASVEEDVSMLGSS